MSLLDVYPTLSDLYGLNKRANLDGQSLAPFLQNPNQKSEQSVISTQGPGNHAVRSQNWRYIRYSHGSEELYDHRIDPSEFKNLADDPQHSSIVEALRQHIPASDAALSPTERSLAHKQPPAAR